MAETDTEIRYGLTRPETIEGFPEGKVAKNISVRVFEEQEDTQWCVGVLMRRFRGARSFRPERRMDAINGLNTRVSEAREDGRVPFRIAGPREKVSSFLQKTGQAEIEFVH